MALTQFPGQLDADDTITVDQLTCWRDQCACQPTYTARGEQGAADNPNMEHLSRTRCQRFASGFADFRSSHFREGGHRWRSMHNDIAA
jgi:hypothetical protein